MTNLARMHDAVGRYGHLAQRPRVFRFPEERPWQRFSLKARKVISDWYHSIEAAAMIATLLLFAAMAMLVTIYAVLFLVAFILNILGVA